MSGESVIVNRPKLNVILIALFLSIDLCGQDVSKLLIFESIDDHQQTLERYARTFKVTDSLSAFKEVLHVISNMQRDGYLTASLDSIKNIDESYGAHIFVGKRYKWGQLKMSGVPADWRKSAFNRKWNQSINGSDYSRPFAKLLEHANNNGYPFARVQLDSLLVVENSVFGTLQFKPGPLIRFDTLDINGTESRKKYLSSYLKIHPGSLYNERKANKIPEYFENLPYYNLQRPVQLLFHNEDARLGLEVERVKANSFDGIIGLLPNSSSNGKTLITGELNLELLNPFESGKELKLHWQRLREESQYLDLGIKFPHFMGTPMDVFVEYRQLKEDTTFINRNAKLGAEVDITSRSDFRFFVDIKSAGLLSSDQMVSQANLPENIDFGLTRYGWGYSYYTLSAKDLRDEGVRLLSEFSLGNKKIRRNSNLDDSVYEELALNSAFYQLEVDITYRKVVNSLITFHHQVRSGHLISVSKKTALFL